MQRKFYTKSGFDPPWIGYIAKEDDTIVGICAFKGKPVGNAVEIAYFTIPTFEGNGFATQMAMLLSEIARATDPNVVVTARTLPQQNASTRVLLKAGFSFTSEINDPGDGKLWEWKLDSK